MCDCFRINTCNHLLSIAGETKATTSITIGTNMPNGQRFRPIKQDIMRASKSSTSTNLSFPIEDNDYGMLLMFRDYQFRPSSERGFSQLVSAGSTVSDTIFLPLPANISDSFAVRIQRFDQGSMGETVSSLISEVDIDNLGIGSITGALSSSALKSMPNIQGSNASEIAGKLSQDLAFLARKGIDQAFPNQGRNIDAGTGTFVNPKAALSFDGVEMKTHSFDWTMAPKSSQESVNLQQISDTIKRNMLPQYVNTSVIQRAMFKYPAMVDIFFVGVDPDYYFHFKTAMIQTFSSNFTTNGNAILRGGRPAVVQMQMNIIESDIHTSEDYGGSSVDIDTESTSTNLNSTDQAGRIIGGI